MGGLSCAKTIIDNGKGLTQAITTHSAAVDRLLGCMSTSINLSAGKSVPVYPTEQMETDFLATSEAYKAAVKLAAGPFLKVIAQISNYCDPTKPTGS